MGVGWAGHDDYFSDRSALEKTQEPHPSKSPETLFYRRIRVDLRYRRTRSGYGTRHMCSSFEDRKAFLMSGTFRIGLLDSCRQFTGG